MVSIRKALISAGLLLAGVGASRAQMPSFLAPPPIAPNLAGPNTLEDRNDSVLEGNPFLDGPRTGNLGWFATVDIGLDGSHVHNELNAPVTIGGAAHTVALPSANLNWTVSPRFEVGYRFGEAAGELIVSYRFISTDGTQTTPSFGAPGTPGSLHSQLAMNVIDIDYACRENAIAPWADMKWRMGLRVANLLFASQESSPLLSESVSNYFVGAGPHAALELWVPAQAHFAFYGKIDGAGVFGSVEQNFAETITGVGTGTANQSTMMPTIMLQVEAGVSWAPTDAWRFTLGYTYEHWWDATYDNSSRGDVWVQGILFRAEWKY